MVATAQETMASKEIAVLPAVKKISWETFQKKYLTREDNFKYEWVNGAVEKTPRTMDNIHIPYQQKFNKLLRTLNDSGEFIQEVDTFFSGAHRRPDIAYFSDQQIQAAKKRERSVPQFVIEVISTNDQMKKVYRKMKDYRAAEVQVIWHVFPDLEEVHVYHGKRMQICTGDDVCSAEPVIMGFLIPVKELFD